jgi:hypothetical protein
MMILLQGKFIDIPDTLTPDEQQAEIKRLTDIAEEAKKERLKRYVKAVDSDKPFSGARWQDDPQWQKYDPKKGGL